KWEVPRRVGIKCSALEVHEVNLKSISLNEALCRALCFDRPVLADLAIEPQDSEIAAQSPAIVMRKASRVETVPDREIVGKGHLVQILQYRRVASDVARIKVTRLYGQHSARSVEELQGSISQALGRYKTRRPD